MTNRQYMYVRCSESDLPDDVQFDVPGQNQGQIVEVAYGGTERHPRAPYGFGDPYRRIHDRSDDTTAYYKRVAADVEITLRAKAFSHEGVRMNRCLVSGDGTVRVWDSIAGHFTFCYTLTENAKRRVLKAARANKTGE